MMGKYSTPVTFQGAKQQGVMQRHYPKIDWAAVVDERVDVVQAMWEHAGVDLSHRGTHRQLNGKCPYPDCTSREDAFMVWPTRSPKTKNHYHCRKCDRSGDIIKLLEDLNGWDFPTTLEKLGLNDAGDQPLKPRGESLAQKRQREHEEWARKQLEMLQHLYPRMQTALEKYERPRAYLASRGISLEQAQQYGLGYFPAPQETGKPAHKELWRWQGRIIFPLTGPDGQMTFAGRSLAFWKPGMSPEDHKAAIDAYNARFEKGDRHQIQRVYKTLPCGHFGYREAVESGCIEWKIPEGEFDALSLLLAGVIGVVAMGTGFSLDLIPIAVESVVLAMDADSAGNTAAQKLAEELAGVGLSTRQVFPTNSKDWNDMFVSQGTSVIAALFQNEKQGNQVDQAGQIDPIMEESAEGLCAVCLDEGRETLASQVGDDDLMYCEKHYIGYHSTPAQTLSPEQITGQVAALFPSCDISFDIPAGGLREVAERGLMQQSTSLPRTQAEYWAVTRRKLNGFRAVPPPIHQEMAARPQVYLYDSPRYELRQVDGVYQLYEIGVWLKDGGCILYEQPRPMAH